MKIELRYLDRKTGNNYTIGGRTAFAIRETVLQYRYSNQGKIPALDLGTMLANIPG